MRSFLAVTVFVLVTSLAGGSGLAAKQQTAAKSFDACVSLAKSRGYNKSDRAIGDPNAPVYKFVHSCMQGKQS